MELFGEDFTPAVIAGSVCAMVHIVCAALFAYVLPDGPWRKYPGFLAHRVVALPLMVVLGAIGTPAWMRSQQMVTTTERFERVHESNDPATILLVQVVLGTQIMWDIPATVLVPSLYSPVMLVHHLVLAALCPFVMFTPYVMFYVPFYGGVIEISSIPLVIYTALRPNRFGEYARKYAMLGLLDKVSTYTFVLLFLLIRGFYFPFVTLVYLLPDMLGELMAGMPPLAPCSTIVSSIGFMLLQMIWGKEVVVGVLAAARPKPAALV